MTSGDSSSSASKNGRLLAELRQVSLTFPGPRKGFTLRRWRSGLAKRTPVTALRQVTFEIRAGQCVGLIGRNGSGKTTLLRTIAGIYRPTSGNVVGATACRIGLVGLGQGVRKDLSGRDNAILGGLLIGMSRREVQRRLPSIIAFSGLGERIDDPVRTYSTGMRARLSFAVATSVSSDILLVDELIAVGDGPFRRRCERRLGELMGAAGAAVVCSHDLHWVERTCGHAVWMDQGTACLVGPAKQVVAAYREAIGESGSSARPYLDQASGGPYLVAGQ